MPLGNITFGANFNVTDIGTSEFGGPSFTAAMSAALNLVSGTLANQADLLYAKQRTVLSGANDDIDLNGVLTGGFGQAVNFVKLVGLIIINAPLTAGAAANTTNLTIGAGTNPFLGFLGGTTPTIGPIRPGGFLMLGAPDLSGLGTVTPTTADILRIANSAGASATYQIGILGRSA